LYHHLLGQKENSVGCTMLLDGCDDTVSREKVMDLHLEVSLSSKMKSFFDVRAHHSSQNEHGRSKPPRSTLQYVLFPTHPRSAYCPFGTIRWKVRSVPPSLVKSALTYKQCAFVQGSSFCALDRSELNVHVWGNPPPCLLPISS
jgi:hypothetical protein